jgi:adenylosuccinate lyase
VISRYVRPEMGKLWCEQQKYLRWLEVELAVARVQAKYGLIPSRDFKALDRGIRKIIADGGVDYRRVEELEETTKHDVIAFTSAVTELLGPEGRWLHFGLTSSDVVDSALSLALRQSGQHLLKQLEEISSLLEKRAREFRDLPCLGRTHGRAAEPTSFGLKFLSWHQETRRNIDRLQRGVENVSFGKLSGAVGCNAVISTAMEEEILVSLGLHRELVSTQVIPRDRHAQFVLTLGLIGSGLERIALEVRHLQRSEVGEAYERFSKGQKGSSAMPHKRNPIASENITGCARLLRGYAGMVLENVALWHERDISHSAVERVALPDSIQLLDYAIHRMTQVLAGLQVDQDRIQSNLFAQSGVLGSGQVLLRLVQSGMSREEAYAFIQSAALSTQSQDVEGFVDRLHAYQEIRGKIGRSELLRLISMDYHLREVPSIYKKALSRKKAKTQTRTKG